MSKHIGSNFDDFLKEENIHIPIHSEWFLNPLEAYDQIKKELSRKEQECKANEDLVNEYFNKIMILEDSNLRLKQTLTEIKEIALKSNMPPCLDIDCKCENCKDIVTNKGFNCMQYGLDKILHKISEVVDEK